MSTSPGMACLLIAGALGLAGCHDGRPYQAMVVRVKVAPQSRATCVRVVIRGANTPEKVSAPMERAGKDELTVGVYRGKDLPQEIEVVARGFVGPGCEEPQVLNEESAPIAAAFGPGIGRVTVALVGPVRAIPPPLLLSSRPASPSRESTQPVLVGRAEPGSTVRVYAAAECAGGVRWTVPANSAGDFEVGVAAGPNAETRFSANATLTNGDEAGCSEAFRYVHDAVAPSAPLWTGIRPPSPSNDASPELLGITERGATVTVFQGPGCLGTAVGSSVADDAGLFVAAVPAVPNSLSSYSARAADLLGNASACSLPLEYLHDGAAPATPVLSGTTPSMRSNTVLAPLLNGTAEAGATIQAYVLPGCAGSPVASGTVNGLGAFSLAVPVAANATTELSVVAVDAAGNASSCAAPVLFTHDSLVPPAPIFTGTVPSSPSRTITQPSVHGTAELGSTVTLIAGSHCLGFVVGTAQLVSSTAFDFSVTVSANSASTFSAKATDAAGNASACSSDLVYVHDNTPPLPAQALATNPASPSNQNALAITGSGEPGATARIFTAAGCGGAEVGNGTVDGSGSFSVSVFVSDNSTTAFFVRLRDVAGNDSACSSGGVSYVEDSLAPVAPQLVQTAPLSPSSDPTPQLSGQAEASAWVDVFTNASCQGTPVGGGAVGVGGNFDVGVTVAANAVTVLYATATDGAKNRSPCSGGLPYRHDDVAPGAPTINGSNPPSPTKVSTSPLFSGSAEAGATVELFVGDCSGSSVASAIATGGGGFSAQVNVLPNTTTTFVARATDAAKNTSACSPPFTYVHDDQPPSKPILTSTLPASPANDNNPKVSGLAEKGAKLQLYKDEGCAVSVGPEATVAQDGAFSVQVSVADDSATDFYAVATDAAGNSSGCSVSFSKYVEDSLPPGAPGLTGLSPGPLSRLTTAPELSGSAEPGAAVLLFDNSLCSGAAVASGSADDGGSFLVVASVAPQSTTTFFAKAVDAAQNGSTCSSSGLTFTHDSVAPESPTFSGTEPASPSSSVTTTLAGAAEAGSTVKIFPGAGCAGALAGEGSAAGGSFAILVSAPANATTDFYATATDAAGNVSSCTNSIAYTHDDQAPLVPTFGPSAPTSPGKSLTPLVNGNAEPGSTVRFYSDGTCQTPVPGATAVVGVSSAFSIQISVPDNVTTTVYATAEDLAHNVSPCTSPGFAYTADNQAPGTPAFTAILPGPASNSNTTPVLVGTAEALALVDVYPNAACSGTPLGSAFANGGGVFAVQVTVQANSVNLFYARATDAAGNPSGCTSSPLGFVHDNVPPDAPVWTGSSPASPSKASTTPTLSGTAESSTFVSLFRTADCSGTSEASQVAEGGAFSFPVTVAANTTTEFSIRTVDFASNASPCSGSLRYTHDNLAPSPPGPLWTSPASPSNSSTTPTILGRAEVGTTVRLFAVGGCPATPIASATAVSSPLFNFTFGQTVSPNSTTTWVLNATDTAGNVSACSAAVAFTHDNIPPSPPTITGTAPSSPSKSQTPSVAGTGPAFNTVHIFTTSNCTGAESGSALVGAGATFSVAAAATVNATTTFYANMTDTAGNPSTCSSGFAYICDTVVPVLGGALAASSNGDNAVALSWPAAADNLPGSPGNISYEICRSTAPGSCAATFVATYTTGAGALTLNATPLSQGTRYYFVIRAVDAAGNTSALSAEVNARTTGKGVARSIASGMRHTCMVLSDGTIRCWGANDLGQVGNEASGAPVGTPTQVAGIADAVQVAAGDSFTCALVGLAKVKCWGNNQYWQTGANSPVVQLTPTEVVGLTGVAQVSAGKEHACAVLVDGTARCWGRNAAGQLGNATTTDSASPVQVSGLANAIGIAAGADHTCAVQSGGTVRCWGSNQAISSAGCSAGTCDGKAGGSSSLVSVAVFGVANAKAVAVGYDHSCALLSSGGVSCWGSHWQSFMLGLGALLPVGTSTPLAVSGVTNAIRLAAGNYHSCVVTAQGTARCWGKVGSGQLGNGSTGPPVSGPVPVTALDAAIEIGVGGEHSCAVRADGTARCWGSNQNKELGDPALANPTTTPAPVAMPSAQAMGVKVAVGGFHACAVVSDGTVRCWGWNNLGALGIGSMSPGPFPTPTAVSGLSGAKALGLGYMHSCALVSDGTVFCWGSNLYGQLGDGATATKYSPQAVPGVTGAVGVVAGSNHSCAVLYNGTVWCWGQNNRGQLGNGTNVDSHVPALVTGVDKAISIAAADFHTCVRTVTGTVQCWGGNTDGQLGDNSTSDRSTPVTTVGMANATSVAAGQQHSCATRSDGVTLCWGSGSVGQLGRGSTTSSLTPVQSNFSNGVQVAAGGAASCGRTAVGQVWCWGSNLYGEVGSGVVGGSYKSPSYVLSNSVDLAFGRTGACVILSGGTAQCWGDNAYGQVGDGAVGGKQPSPNSVTLFP